MRGNNDAGLYGYNDVRAGRQISVFFSDKKTMYFCKWDVENLGFGCD